jgi:BON domain
MSIAAKTLPACHDGLRESAMGSFDRRNAMSNYQKHPNEREVRPYGDEEADFSSDSSREFDRENSTNRSGRYRERERRTPREGRGGWEREGRGTRGEYGRESWEREARDREFEGRARGWEGYGAREREDLGKYEDWRDSESRYGREGGRGSRGFAGGYEVPSDYESPSYRSRGDEGGYGWRGYEGERRWNRPSGASVSDMRGFEGDYGRESWGRYDDRYAPRGYESGPRHRSDRGEHEFGSPRFESAGFGAGPEGISGMGRGYERGQGAWSQGSVSSWETPSYAGVGPRGYQRSDERVREDVCDRLERDARIDASNIEVDVQSGMVTLKGSVDDRRIKRQAEEAIESLPGVKDVLNQIRVEKRFSAGRASESKEGRAGDGGTTSRESGREGKDRKPTTTL